MPVWQKRQFLIWGTTYPEFSKTHYETVCTGAIDRKSGSLARIYPITLRYHREPFGHYDWIEAEVARNDSDFRPESYKVRQETIQVVGSIPPGKDWEERSKWALRDGNVFGSVEELVLAEARDHTSLGLVKPKEVRFYAKLRSPADKAEWDAKREHAISQQDLLVDVAETTRDLEFPWAQYRADFTCYGRDCNGHDMSILDWGLYVLDRKMLQQKGMNGAEAAVLEKLRSLINPRAKDAYFYLGNTKPHPQNFMIVGLYYPPRVPQLKLDLG